MAANTDYLNRIPEPIIKLFGDFLEPRSNAYTFSPSVECVRTTALDERRTFVGEPNNDVKLVAKTVSQEPYGKWPNNGIVIVTRTKEIVLSYERFADLMLAGEK